MYSLVHSYQLSRELNTRLICSECNLYGRTQLRFWRLLFVLYSVNYLSGRFYLRSRISLNDWKSLFKLCSCGYIFLRESTIYSNVEFLSFGMSDDQHHSKTVQGFIYTAFVPIRPISSCDVVYFRALSWCCLDQSKCVQFWLQFVCCGECTPSVAFTLNMNDVNQCVLVYSGRECK